MCGLPYGEYAMNVRFPPCNHLKTAALGEAAKVSRSEILSGKGVAIDESLNES